MQDIMEPSVKDVDILAHELDRLLARYKPALKQEGIDRQVENLKRWLESNRNDFGADRQISETGNAWLVDLRDGLKLAAEERQRLEGEGGIPANKEQAEENEELLRVLRRIEHILNKASAAPY